MNRVFVRLFTTISIALLIFWLTTVFLTGIVIQQLREQYDADMPRARMVKHLADAHEAAKQHGVEGLTAWAKHVDRAEVVPLLVLTPNDTELLNRPIPRYLQRRFNRPPRAHNPLPSPEIWINGQRYLILADFRGVTLKRILNRPSILAIPFAVGVSVSALIGWMLARWISRPIKELRRASKGIAQGDFSSRVSLRTCGRKDELGALANDFNHMASKLSDYQERQTRLLSDMSHELRTPLSRLYVALAVAAKSDAPDAALTRAEKEAQHLEELIHQVLTISKLSTSESPIHKTPFSLSTLLDTIIADANYEHQEACVVAAYNDQLHLHGDENLLHHAIENVVRNAIKYSPGLGSVHIHAQPQHHEMVITVNDNGPGVPAEKLSILFEPFARLDEARSREQGGYGLGLAIAKQAVSLHGGSISATQREPHGLSITIRLPLS